MLSFFLEFLVNILEVLPESDSFSNGLLKVKQYYSNIKSKIIRILNTFQNKTENPSSPYPRALY
jgi:hypothetical protein